MQPRRISTGYSYTPIGAMNSRISILAPAPSSKRDANGNFPDPLVLATVWARIQSLTSKYTEKQQQVVSEATHKVTIRFIPDLTTAMLVQNGSKIFNIEAIFDPDDRQVELNLMVYERNDGR